MLVLQILFLRVFGVEPVDTDVKVVRQVGTVSRLGPAGRIGQEMFGGVGKQYIIPEFGNVAYPPCLAFHQTGRFLAQVVTVDDTVHHCGTELCQVDELHPLVMAVSRLVGHPDEVNS